MKRKWLMAGGVVLLLVAFTVIAYACDWIVSGRMTGGGSICTNSVPCPVQVNGGTDSFRVTHGFEVHCGDGLNVTPPGPNNLEVNWPSTDGSQQNRFHLDFLASGYCTNDPNIEPTPPSAGFDTFQGKGCGTLTYNGTSYPGAYIEFTFTDAGEPGTKDTEAIYIQPYAATDCLSGSGTAVLPFGPTLLTKGNHQAHKDNN